MRRRGGLRRPSRRPKKRGISHVPSNKKASPRATSGCWSHTGLASQRGKLRELTCAGLTLYIAPVHRQNVCHSMAEEENKQLPANHDRSAPILIVAVLAVITVTAFWGVWRHDFINYDDVTYVTENEHVKHGLDWPTVVWAFTHSHAFNYHPLTWISHALDCELYG